MANWGKNRRGYKKGYYSPRRKNSSSSNLSAWIITPRMLRNSIWVIQEMRESEEGYEVKSSSKGNDTVYHFNTEKCDCPGYKKRGYCKHTIAAILYEIVKTASKRS